MKVAFITGASSGIGEHTAREIVRRGGKVALVARRKEKLDALVKELGADNAIALAGDVNKDGDIEAAVEKTLAHYGRIDTCFANAGISITGNVDTTTHDDFRRQFETNVHGVLRTVYATLPAVKKTRGQIAVVGSVAGYLAMPAGAAYSMSKAAVRILCGALKHELRPYGVNVMHIAPGFVQSEIRLRDNAGVMREDFNDPVPAWMQMRTDVAAKKIVDALEKRKSELVLTGHGKFIVAFERNLPRLFDFVMGKVLMNNAKKMGLVAK